MLTKNVACLVVIAGGLCSALGGAVAQDANVTAECSAEENHRPGHADRAGAVAVCRQFGGCKTGRRQADDDRRVGQLHRLC